MATKQEALKVLLATYSKLKQLYTQDPELQADATEEDKALYEKVGAMYEKLKNNGTTTISPKLDELRKVLKEWEENWKQLSALVDLNEVKRLKSTENGVLHVKNLTEEVIPHLETAINNLKQELEGDKDANKQELADLETLSNAINQQKTVLKTFLQFQEKNQLSEKDSQTVVSIVGTLENEVESLLRQKALLSPTTNAAELQEVEDKLKCIKTYKNDLLDLVTSQAVRIDYADRVVASVSDPETGETKEIEIDAQILYDQEFNTFVVQCRHGAAEALIAHEMQHLIQVKNGKLGLVTSGIGTCGLLYDIFDEQEAYQVQFLIAPKTVPGYPKTIQSFNDLTTANIRTFSDAYTDLPETDYNVTSTLNDILLHPPFQQQLKCLPHEIAKYGNLPFKNWIEIFFGRDSFIYLK